ncbi:uncharacterized protein [Rutidosis leptorrhynchoides]|uniref:uncharacterized protein n=1 Tax=Rutidosis leptorrhynchoides TaxID=125765 RepID=UPI003A99D922
MAGTLPGVEIARRRRLRGWSDPASLNGSGFGSTRIRVSQDTHITPTLSFFQRSLVNQADEDDKLGGPAREAKERLDGRLRGNLKQEFTRQTSQERLRRGSTNATSTVMENLQVEVYGSKNKRLRWGRMGLSWKSSKQEECAICLDVYKASDKITHLPCTHRFHFDCLVPWLESDGHCPCCRATVF